MLPLMALRAFSPTRALQLFTKGLGGREASVRPTLCARASPPLAHGELQRVLARLPGPPWAPEASSGWRSALGFVDIYWDPRAVAYFEAVREIRALRVADVRYERPAAKGGAPSAAFAQVRPSGAPGGYLPLVREEECPYQHILEAMKVCHPFASTSCSLPPSLLAAVDFVCSHLQDVEQERRRRVDALARIAARLEPLNATVLRPVMPPSVWLLSGGYNLVFLAALIDALEWPDTSLVQRFTLGFPVLGHIPDSGVFAPLPYSTPCVSTDELVRSNVEYAGQCARSAVRRAATDPDSAEVWRKTLEEVQEKGTMIGPFSRSDLDSAFGFGHWRPIPRFGTWQKGSLRPIDDARSSRVNACMCMSEALVCSRADFPLHVARAFALRVGARFSMLIGTDDIASAYRMIPAAQPGYTVVCLSEPGSGRASFFLMPGHNFGLACAPVSFNRLPSLTVFAARLLLGVPCEHFYDDACVVDVACSAASSQSALSALHSWIGIPFADAKHVPATESEPFLGVQSDLRRLPSDGLISLSIKPSRREKLVDAVCAAISSRLLCPAAAGSLAGKLMFVLLSIFGKVGRAAIGDLQAHARGGTDRVSDATLEALVFFRDFLVATPTFTVPALPPVDLGVLVWSDASFSRGNRWLPIPESGCQAVLGFVVYSPLSGSFLHSSFVVPPALLALLFSPHEQYVGVLENLAAAAVGFTVPDVLRDRLVLHFVDNQGALANLVSGSSRDVDSKRIVLASALHLSSLSCRVWYEWVASAANIGDKPSRLEFDLVHALRDPSGAPSRPVVMCFPPHIQSAV